VDARSNDETVTSITSVPATQSIIALLTMPQAYNTHIQAKKPKELFLLQRGKKPMMTQCTQ